MAKYNPKRGTEDIDQSVFQEWGLSPPSKSHKLENPLKGPPPKEQPAVHFEPLKLTDDDTDSVGLPERQSDSSIWQADSDNKDFPPLPRQSEFSEKSNMIPDFSSSVLRPSTIDPTSRPGTILTDVPEALAKTSPEAECQWRGVAVISLILNAALVGVVIAFYVTARQNNVEGKCEKIWRQHRSSFVAREFADHCYLFVNVPSYKNNATQICKQLGGWLVQIENKDENVFLDEMTRAINRKDSWLLGGTFVDGHWRRDSDGAVMEFLNFEMGNERNVEEGDQIFLGGHHDYRGKWFHYDKYLSPYICKI